MVSFAGGVSNVSSDFSIQEDMPCQRRTAFNSALKRDDLIIASSRPTLSRLSKSLRSPSRPLSPVRFSNGADYTALDHAAARRA
jgi:hypothetical protein